MRILLLLFSIFLLTSCGSSESYISLNDAERGMFLNRANTTSYKTFFDRRMESELESRANKDWYIVNEDLDYIFYGQLIKKNGFTMINPFYKVKKEKLDTLFPGYRSIEGKHIKAKIFQTFLKPAIEERLISLCPQSYNVQFSKRSYKLTKEGIKANIAYTGRCYENKIFKADLHVLLDTENLEVVNADHNFK